jgi:hypothetical protein
MMHNRRRVRLWRKLMREGMVNVEGGLPGLVASLPEDALELQTKAACLAREGERERDTAHGGSAQW